MKFKLQRHVIDESLFLFCINKIKSDRIVVPRAGKKILEQMPLICKAIQKSGLPSHLLIRKLQGKLGHGVFLHPEAQPLLRGTPIAPYSGEVQLRPQNEASDSDYIFSLISDLRLTKEEQRQWDPANRYHPRRLYSVDLDARRKGNFTRFINHSEEPNVEAQFVRIPSKTGAPSFEIVYVARKTIRPGEQLLVCYDGEDNSYWGALKIKPFPMTPKTFVLDLSCEIVSERQQPLHR